MLGLGCGIGIVRSKDFGSVARLKWCIDAKKGKLRERTLHCCLVGAEKREK